MSLTAAYCSAETKLQSDWTVLVRTRLHPDKPARLLPVASQPACRNGLQRPTVNCCGLRFFLRSPEKKWRLHAGPSGMKSTNMGPAKTPAEAASVGQAMLGQRLSCPMTCQRLGTLVGCRALRCSAWLLSEATLETAYVPSSA